MSKGMDEYEGRKSCAITTAKRLAQFLGKCDNIDSGWGGMTQHMAKTGLGCDGLF